MTKLLCILSIYFTFVSTLHAQTIEELYQQRDHQSLMAYQDKTDSLSGFELYCIGFAFFQSENDKEAIRMYDMAIDKGLNDDYIYLYKGIALNFLKNYDQARVNFRKAIVQNPLGQKNYTELGNSFYFQRRYDSALVYFYKAREQEYELSDPYEKIPEIYVIKKDYVRAAKELEISSDKISKDAPEFLEILSNLGSIAYATNKDYKQATRAYTALFKFNPDAKDIHSKMIKAYYADENYAKGDSIIQALTLAFEKGELNDDFMKFKSVIIDQFYWNGQRVSVQKYFEKPKEFADEMYKFFLINKAGDKVERTIQTEKTLSEPGAPSLHLLGEYVKSTGGHQTFNYGFKGDDISYPHLKESVIKVLDGENPTASFSPGSSNSKRKKKKRSK